MQSTLTFRQGRSAAMNKLLRDIFAEAIKRKTDTEFQEFVSSLYSIVYRNRFVAIKQKRDKGADGILNNDTILAGYGPEKPSLRDFKKKISADYKSFKENWKDEYPNWQVVYNGDFTASMVKHIDELHPGADKVGLRQLVELIADQSWPTIRNIGNLLAIPSDYYINDLLAQVVENLMNHDGKSVPPASREKALYIEEKIALNYTAHDIEAATDEYSRSLEYFAALESLLKEYTDNEISALRSRIHRDFNMISGEFKERFESQNARYSEKHPHDDMFCFSVTVVLTYFFEQCLIGKTVEAER